MKAPGEILRFTTPAKTCSYLSDELSALEYRVHVTIPEEDYRVMLERGWRRHGAHFFKPACPDCRKCQSLRVDVGAFKATKSQRKVLNANRDVRFVLQYPTLSEDHIRLYNAYHADMSERRGWRYNQTTPDDYANSFLIGKWTFAREMLYYREDDLIGVALVDLFPDAMSSVYFYHDPAWRDESPGTFSILKELEFCRETGRQWNFLGYWIEDCQSMAYKNRFGPHEILEEYVELETEPTWRRP